MLMVDEAREAPADIRTASAASVGALIDYSKFSTTIRHRAVNQSLPLRQLPDLLLRRQYFHMFSFVLNSGLLMVFWCRVGAIEGLQDSIRENDNPRAVR